MSKTKSYAESELDILTKYNTDPENRPIIEEFRNEIIALCDKFGKSGQSGGSAPYTAQALSSAIKKLCLREPICPLTGLDDEWNDVSYDSGKNETLFQNNRNSALFKNNSGVYYIDAIVFKGQNGSCFTSGGVNLPNSDEIIRSKQYIKSFPFEAKTFYIDVIETEWSDKTETIKQDGGGWWTSIVKDINQLKEVFKYYKCTNQYLLREKKLERL